MALYIGSIVINVFEFECAKEFWMAALDYTVRYADKDFVVLTDPNRRWANISLQQWPEAKQGRNRLHLDLYSDTPQDEVARLESLGAARLDWEYPPDADFYVVMADPDGNEFCVVTTSAIQDSEMKQALSIDSIVINSCEFERMKEFWAAALGYSVRYADDDYLLLTDPNWRWPNILLQSWPEAKQGRNRLHLDLYSDDQKKEVQRLEALGAVRLDWDYPPGADYVVMADLEGNEFCVITTSYAQDSAVEQVAT